MKYNTLNSSQLTDLRTSKSVEKARKGNQLDLGKRLNPKEYF